MKKTSWLNRLLSLALCLMLVLSLAPLPVRAAGVDLNADIMFHKAELTWYLSPDDPAVDFYNRINSEIHTYTYGHHAKPERTYITTNGGDYADNVGNSGFMWTDCKSAAIRDGEVYYVYAFYDRDQNQVSREEFIISVYHRYAININVSGAPSGYGGVTLNGNNVSGIQYVKKGASIALNVEDIPGYKATVTYNNSTYVDKLTHNLNNINGNVEFKVVYEPDEYATVTFQQPTGATIQVNGYTDSPVQVISGQNFTVNIAASGGYMLTGVTIDGTQYTVNGISFSKTLTAGSNGSKHTVSVTTEKVVIPVHTTAGINYTKDQDARTLIKAIFNAVYAGDVYTENDVGSTHGHSKPISVAVPYIDDTYVPLTRDSAWSYLSSSNVLTVEIYDSVTVRLESGSGVSEACKLYLYDSGISANGTISKEYTGQPVLLSTEDFVWTNPSGYYGGSAVGFQYYDQAGNRLSAAPTAPGKYQVRVQSSGYKTSGGLVDETYKTWSGLIPFEITAVEVQSVSDITGSKTYDGTPAALSYTVKTQGNSEKTWNFVNGQCEGFPFTPEYSYKAQGDADFADGLPVLPGSYTVQIKIDSYTATAQISINHNASVEFDENGFCPNGCYEPAELKDGVYEIANAGNLFWLGQQIPGASGKFYAKLTADITFPDGKVWTPIGAPESVSMDSVLDGDGHFINMGNQSGGLFASFNYGTVKNLTLYGSITAEGGSVGAIAGSAYRTYIQNVISYVSVTNPGGNAGGLVGYFGGKHDSANGRYSKIENCAVYADISGSNAGGLVGEGWNGTQYWDIYNCAYVGDVTGTNAGAIVGYLNTDTNTCTFNTVYWCEQDGLDFYGKRDTTNQKYINTEAKNVEAFASGEVSYLLGSAWGQNIGQEDRPVVGGARVYYGYLSCADDAGMVYTNDVNALAEKPAHNWQDATCTEPKTCPNCNTTEGAALGHTPEQDDGNCLTPVNCSVCGGVATPAKDAHNFVDGECDNPGCVTWETYTMTYYVDGEKVHTETHTCGSAYYLWKEAPQKEDLTLLGWAEEDGGELKYSVTDYIWPEGDMDFYAVYRKVYTVTYYSYDPEQKTYWENGTADAAAGESLILGTENPWFGKFVGWATEPLGQVVYTGEQEIVLTGNMDLYAILAPFSANIDLGAEDAVYDITTVTGVLPYSTVKLTNFPVRTGYIFLGFADSCYGSEYLICTDEETGEKYIEIQLSEDNVTLTALWKECDHEFDENGFCIHCGGKDPNYTQPVVKPTITLKYPSLSFESEVFYNVYFTATNTEDVEEMGLITWYNRPANTAAATYESAEAVIPGAVHNAGANMYMVRSEGVPAKQLGDNMYIRVYAKLSDGTYAYSPVTYYNAKMYAADILSKSQSAEMKSLVVAMLNYGAAAQVHFDHNTDSLMNDVLTAEQKELVKAYSADMIGSVIAADPNKVGSFKSNGGFSNGYPSVSFEGAFSINYYLIPKQAVESDMILYCWDLNTYNSVDILTEENATTKVVMTKGGSLYAGAYEGIAAKQIDETVFVAGVYTSNGVRYSSPVISYSLGEYCKDQIANGSDTMQEFAKATAVYGNYAKAYFACLEG